MQQSIYNGINTSINGNSIAIPATKTTATAARRASLARRIARRWDMIGVLALMGSSAAYTVFAIAHVV